MGKSEDERENKKEPYWKRITGISDLIEKELNKKWKKHYNVYVYQMLPFPSDDTNKNDFQNQLDARILSFYPPTTTKKNVKMGTG